MKTGESKGIAFTLAITIITCTGLVPVARAAHATNFLNALSSEVTNRVAHPSMNSAAQNAALRAANNILERDTRTLSADVSALAKTATVLHAGFAGDPTLLSLEENALAA